MTTAKRRGPRLATRLFVAFGLVAALPLIVVPLSLRAVNASYDRSFARDLDDAAGIVRREWEREGRAVLDAANAAAQGPLMAEVLRLLRDGEAAELVTRGPDELVRSGFDVLQIVDARGEVLLSGHLPAKLGDRDEEALRLLRQRAGTPLLAQIDVKRGDEILPVLALVAAVPARAGGGALAGRIIDDALLDRWGELIRGRVDWVAGADADGLPSGAEQLAERVFGQARAHRDVPLDTSDVQRTVRIRLSDTALVETKIRIVLGALVAFGIALAFGIVLAIWLTRRTVEPIEALVEGTRRLSEGDLSHRVDVKASGEVGELVDAFNGMASELAQANARLARAERVAAWEQIARSLAHEIKNPLTPISMAIETLLRAYDRQHPQFERFFREGTATVLEEVERLKRLATEFGEFARWPKPMLSPAHPDELIRSAAALYASLPEGVTVVVEPAEGLPDVVVDRDQIQRALVNLVKNALEAMDGPGRIVLRAVAGDGGVVLEVQDSGPGVPDEVRERLFEPYLTTKAEGTGLGLAIVQRIASEHGGHVDAVNSPGGGATFRLWVPCAEPSVAAAG